MDDFSLLGLQNWDRLYWRYTYYVQCCTLSFYYGAAAASWSSDPGHAAGTFRLLFASNNSEAKGAGTREAGSRHATHNQTKAECTASRLHNLLMKSYASTPAQSDCTWTANPEHARGAIIS